MGGNTVTDSIKSPELRVRLITACIITPIAIMASLLGGLVFLSLASLVMCIGMLEFYVMEKDTATQGSSLTGIPTGLAVVAIFHWQRDALLPLALVACVIATFVLELARRPARPGRAAAQVGTTLCGVVYLALPTAFLISLRSIPGDGVLWLFVVFAITWGTDTFGYVFGKIFGKTKLAPLISPNKTVEGAIGGILCAWIPAFLILAMTDAYQPILIPMVALGPLLAVSGDLFESALKRFFRVKDSYVAGFNIFPGHGGVLDRIDALVWVTTWVFFYLLAVGIV